MDGLADFERKLALKKKNQEQTAVVGQDKSQESSHSRHHHHRHHHHNGKSRDESRSSRTSHRQKDRHGRSDKETKDHGRGKTSIKPEAVGELELDAENRHRAKRSRLSRQHPRSNEDTEPEFQPSEEGDKDAGPADPLPGSEPPKPHESLSRDSWMTSATGVNIDYIHRRRKQEPSVSDDPANRPVSDRDLNKDVLNQLNSGMAIEELKTANSRVPNYKFGDKGWQWRMTTLDAVFKIAKQNGRSIEDVALERYGSLQDFDDAREEKDEMEKRRLYGAGYVVKESPTGRFNQERVKTENAKLSDKEKGQITTDLSPTDLGGMNNPHQALPMDQTALNRLRAQLMKAKLRKCPDVAKLEREYSQAVALFSSESQSKTGRAEVLDAGYSRILADRKGEVKAVETKRERTCGAVEANEDMSIEDMLREERRTRGIGGGDGVKLAERIAKDTRFSNDLEYLDENAEKLAKQVHKSDASLKSMAAHEFTKINNILETCPLCHHEDRSAPHDRPVAPIISLATRVFLTVPTEPELTGAEGGAVIVPIEHHTNLLECGDDEWEEIRNFMKALTRLYHDQGREVIFYENATTPHRRLHAALIAVPIPYSQGDTAPAFFREAILTSDDEWSQHVKIIDTAKRAREGLGKSAFRKCLPKEMPYFHVWFSLDGGLGHVVENQDRWPKGDLFAREVIGGMLDVEPSIIRRQGRWTRHDSRMDTFQQRWKKFDWTRVLREDSRKC